jgi:hypothetical protein
MASEQHSFSEFRDVTIYIQEAFGGGYTASVKDLKYRMKPSAFSTDRSEAIQKVKEQFVKEYYETEQGLRENF